MQTRASTNCGNGSASSSSAALKRRYAFCTLGGAPGIFPKPLGPKNALSKWCGEAFFRNLLVAEAPDSLLRVNRRHYVQSAARFPTRASNVRLAVRPRHLNRNREDLGRRTNRPASGHALGVGCHQVVQLEQSHEHPSPRAVRKLRAPVHGISHVGGGPRVRRRPLEVQAHRAAVHRGAGRPRRRLRQRRASVVRCQFGRSRQTQCVECIPGPSGASHARRIRKPNARYGDIPSSCAGFQLADRSAMLPNVQKSVPDSDCGLAKHHQRIGVSRI